MNVSNVINTCDRKITGSGAAAGSDNAAAAATPRTKLQGEMWNLKHRAPAARPLELWLRENILSAFHINNT